MKIYEVFFRQEDGRDGVNHAYATSRKKAEAIARQLKRDYAAAVKVWNDANAANVGYYNMPVSPGEDPDPQIRALEFHGTVREMIIQALEQNA